MWLNMLCVFNNIAAHLSSSAAASGIPIQPVLITGLETCIAALSRDGCVEGIFRQSGRLEEVNSLYYHFLCGGTGIPADMSVDVHAVAGVTKKMLREMPETIFTNRLFELVVQQNPTPTRVSVMERVRVWEGEREREEM